MKYLLRANHKTSAGYVDLARYAFEDDAREFITTHAAHYNAAGYELTVTVTE